MTTLKDLCDEIIFTFSIDTNIPYGYKGANYLSASDVLEKIIRKYLARLEWEEEL